MPIYINLANFAEEEKPKKKRGLLKKVAVGAASLGAAAGTAYGLHRAGVGKKVKAGIKKATAKPSQQQQNVKNIRKSAANDSSDPWNEKGPKPAKKGSYSPKPEKKRKQRRRKGGTGLARTSGQYTPLPKNRFKK